MKKSLIQLGLLGCVVGFSSFAVNAAESRPSAVTFGVSPENLDFGTIEQGKPSEPKEITITNRGTKELALVGIQLPKETSATHTCNAYLKTGESCKVSAVLNPKYRGERTGTLVIETSAGDQSIKTAANVTRAYSGASAMGNAAEISTSLVNSNSGAGGPGSK